MGWSGASALKKAPRTAMACPKRDTVNVVPRMEPNVLSTTSAETTRAADAPPIAPTASATGWEDAAAPAGDKTIMTAAWVRP